MKNNKKKVKMKTKQIKTNKPEKNEASNVTECKSTRMTIKKKLLIIIPIVSVLLIAVVLAGLYFYYFYYMKPNFEEGELQRISSSHEGVVKPGDEITYYINFTNTGNTAVSALKIKTIIPVNTEFISSSPDADYNESAGYITFNAMNIPGGTSGNASFTVRVITPLDNGTIISTGEVTMEYVSRNETETFRIPGIIKNTVESSPDFSGFELIFYDLNKGDININDEIEFVIKVKNSGDMNAEDINLVNIWPDKFDININSLMSFDKLDKNKKTISWNIDELNANDMKTFKFRAKIGSDFKHQEVFEDFARVYYIGEVVNEVSVKGEITGYLDFSTSVNSVSDANGGSTWAGDILTYKINVINTGLKAGKDIKVICPVPANTSYVQASAIPAEAASLDSNSNSIIWTIDTLNPDEEKTFTFSVAISNGLTGGGTISSAFHIEGENQYLELENTAVRVRGFINQTIVCKGDSMILMNNWVSVLDSLLESRYPRADYNTIGVGKGGQMSWQAVPTFDSTVAPYGPHVVVLGYGSNDAGYSVSAFVNGMTHLIQKAKGINATVIVYSIGYIDTGKWPTKANYKEYNEALKGVCSANGVPYVDIFSPMAANPGAYLADGLHWSEAGASLVAHLVFNTIINYLDTDGERR